MEKKMSDDDACKKYFVKRSNLDECFHLSYALNYISGNLQ